MVACVQIKCQQVSLKYCHFNISMTTHGEGAPMRCGRLPRVSWANRPGSSRQRWRMDSASRRIVAAGFCNFLTLALLLPVIPRFVKGPLGSGDIGVGVAVASFSVAAMATRPFVGRLGDRHGRRTLITFGAVIMIFSLFGHLFAQSLGVFLVLRAAHALGSASFYTGALSMMVDLAPPDRKGRAVSVFTIGRNVAYAFGPVLGEMIVRVWGYDVLWATSALAAVAALALGMGVAETKRSVVAPAIPSKWFPRASLAPGIVIALVMFGYASLTTFAALYVRSLGVRDAGGVFLLHAVVVIVVRGAAANRIDQFDPGQTARVALGFSAIGLVTIGSWHHIAGLYGGVLLFSTGVALVVPALVMQLLDRATPEEQTSALGTFTAFFDLGIAMGALTLGGVATVWGYAMVYVVAGVVVAGGFFVIPKPVVGSVSNSDTGSGNA